MKSVVFDLNFTGIGAQMCNWPIKTGSAVVQAMIVCLPNGQQAITRTNADPVLWRILDSKGDDEDGTWVGQNEG